MNWISPLSLSLRPTADSESYRVLPPDCTGLPLAPHPGAFGVQRKHHVHEGIDLYAPEGSPVFAVEDGEVIAVRSFTGPALGHTWWLPTQAVWVAGESGVVVYGELAPCVQVGKRVCAGGQLGVVARVLQKDKGRPTSMLHLELRAHGNTADIEWLDIANQPVGLLDPTPHLLNVCA